MVTFGRKLHPKERASYDHVSASLLEGVRIFKIKKILRRYTGITLGNWIFLTSDEPQDGTSLLIAHELVHVRQWNQQGKVRFLSSYLRCFVKGFKQHKDWACAYREIDAECEARSEAQHWADGHLC